jgi:predicted MPP superfamily phosphohydrolase
MDERWLVAAITGTAGLFAYGVWESFQVRLMRYELSSHRFPPTHNDFRIAHLSDLHMRRFGARERKAVALVAQWRPHLIALTGDVTAWRRALPAVETLFRHLAEIASLFAVEGNAEAANRLTERMAELLHRCGGHWLRNEAVPFGDGVWVAGTDDPHRHRADAAKALASVPDDAFCILLAHSPDIIAQPAALRADLILCGHTHGGQVRFPLLGAIYIRARKIPRAYAWGCHRLPNGTTLITTSGVGTTRLPIRFLCPPEIVGITIRNLSV